ncbi:MAG: ClbS/DfsB family four-helix bundle protein [Flavobacteriales bacterium]|nr:ClbS/DfsB family four-helix bundle protein [Flavobacteriales bacterium]
MPRPKTKEELLSLSRSNLDKLMELIGSFSVEEQNKDFKKGTLNRNIRDILTHLHHWHLMFLKWYKIGMKGDKPDMPAEGYTWKTLPVLNKEIWKMYQDTSLEEAKKLIKTSFKKVFKLIETHSNDELFEKKRYHWTGSTSLGAYLVSCTSSHYDWGYKLIKKMKKQV